MTSAVEAADPIQINGHAAETLDIDLDEPKYSSKDCVRECAGQFNSVTIAMTNITNILLDFINGVQVSRSEILPRIVSLMKEVDGEKVKTMSEWLPFEERRLFGGIADRLSECEQLTYNNMNKVTDLRHMDFQKQAKEIDTLENIIEEKDKEIKSLKMSENVMLWQREKARILKDHDEKIRELNKTIKKWEDEVESMKRKLNDQRDDLKMEKMKIDLTKRKALANAPADSSELAMLEDMKRKAYLYEKDMQHGQQELDRFQTDMLGLWGGAQGEINSMAEGTKDIAVKTKLKSMNDTIDKIKSAVAGNIDLRVMRADLNERYLPGLSNSDFFVTNRGKKVTIKPICIRKFSKHFSKSSLPPVKALPSINGSLSAASKNGTITPATDKSQAEEDDVPPNPTLLNEPYGTLNTLAIMKHFPTLSSTYVKDQWNNFKRYDADGNGELDMSEIMTAITGLMPKTVKPSHIEAAMREVDSDGSGTMDFYEYLQVAMLLERKKGKSELFHTPEITKYNKQISKTCLIQ